MGCAFGRHSLACRAEISVIGTASSRRAAGSSLGRARRRRAVAMKEIGVMAKPRRRTKKANHGKRACNPRRQKRGRAHFRGYR